VTGFETASTETLTTIRDNLLAGLSGVAGHLDAGTFDTPHGKAGTPPSQSGQTTRILLEGITAELAAREEHTMDLPAAIMVDIDGTVALRGDRSPYDETSVHLDTPNVPVIAAVRAMHAAGHAVVFCSGRREACRPATEAWLTEHVAVPYEVLHMRQPVHEGVKDAVVKTEIYREHVEPRYRVVAVFDDRQQVVDAWRALGLTVFQVAPGAF
jgi:hypothetical protein